MELNIIQELALKPIKKDDRIKCEWCKFNAIKTWNGKCKAGQIYYVDIAHRCTKYNSKIVANNNNLWQPGQKGFWE